MNKSALSNGLKKQMDASGSEICELLRKLISFRTESQNPKNKALRAEADACLLYISEWLSKLGFSSQKWLIPSGPFGELPIMTASRKGAGGRSLVLNGHIDVVPAGDRIKWRHDPFAGIEEDGRLYGRGASDMKSGVASAMMALALIDRAGLDVLGDVSFHLVSDEENVGMGTRTIIERESKACAVIGMEPTDMAYSPAAPGLEHMRIEVAGVSRHAGMRYAEIYDGYKGESVNAIEKCLKLIGALRSLEREWGEKKSYPLLPKGFNTLLPGFIVGGMGGGKDGMVNEIANPGTTPDYCSVEYNIWFYPGEDREDIHKEIEERILLESKKDDWLSKNPPRISWALRDIYFPPMDTPLDHEILKCFESAMLQTGIEARKNAFEAAADLSWYTDKGMPSVLFGPGKIENAHSPNEYVDIEDLKSAALVIAEVIIEWCGVKKRSHK